MSGEIGQGKAIELAEAQKIDKPRHINDVHESIDRAPLAGIQSKRDQKMDAQITARPLIAVKDTGTDLGRGVYATKHIDTGEIVEVAPVVLLALDSQPFPGTVRRLVYNWSKTHVALALGYGSLYNHSDQPNLHFKRDIKNLTISFYARREIEAGEQLTISYDYTGEGKNPRKRSWFEIHQVEKIEVKP